MGKDLKPFMKSFNGYIERMMGYLSDLKNVSEVNHKNLGQQIPQAARLKDEFDLFLEQGEHLAARLEDVMNRAHQIEKQMQETLRRVKYLDRPNPEYFQDREQHYHPVSKEDYNVSGSTMPNPNYRADRDPFLEESRSPSTSDYLPPSKVKNFESHEDRHFERNPYVNKKLYGLR